MNYFNFFFFFFLKKKKLKKKKRRGEDEDINSSEDEDSSLEDEDDSNSDLDTLDEAFEEIEEVSDDCSEFSKNAPQKMKDFLVAYDTKRLVVQEFDYDSYFEFGVSKLKVPSIVTYLDEKKKKKKKNKYEFDEEDLEEEETDSDFDLEFDEEIEKIKASLIFRNFEMKNKKEKENDKNEEKPKNPFDIDFVSFDKLTVDQRYMSKSYYNNYHNNSYRFKDLLESNIVVIDTDEKENNIIKPEFQLKTHNYITSHITRYNFDICSEVDIRFFHDLYPQCFPFSNNIHYDQETDRVFIDYDPISCMDYRHEEIIPNSVLLDPKNSKNIELDMTQEIVNMHSNDNDDNFEEELLAELLNEYSDEENE